MRTDRDRLREPVASTTIDVLALLDEIRAIARTGLHYTESPFDRERYERLLELASRGYADVLGIAPETVRARFLSETGYVTAKVGVDGAVFDDEGRLLLVQRADNRKWALIGGWCDPGESPQDTIVREFAEEIGVDARVERIVDTFGIPANATSAPHGFVSILFLCTIENASFRLAAHEVADVAFRDIDTVDDWHYAHDTFARAARQAWKARAS